MGKATMVTLNPEALKLAMTRKSYNFGRIAEELGYSDSWGKDLARTGSVKEKTAMRIANMLSVDMQDLLKTPASDASAPETPVPEEPDIMADIEKACRLIISKSIEALEKSASCIQIEAAANAVSDVHNILVSQQAQKELRETMNKLQETLKPSESSCLGIGTIPNFKL